MWAVGSPEGITGLRPLADGRTPEPLRLLAGELPPLLLPPLALPLTLGACRAAVIDAIAALNSCGETTTQCDHTSQTGQSGRLRIQQQV